MPYSFLSGIPEIVERLPEQKLFGVAAPSPTVYNIDMSTLSEIEAAVDALPAADKQELLLFLAARLREQASQLPAPRRFSSSQLSSWIAEDETDMQRFRDGNAE